VLFVCLVPLVPWDVCCLSKQSIPGPGRAQFNGVNIMAYSQETKTLLNHLSFGNIKLPKTTMIFNMGPAAMCPSDQLGLCQCSAKCYAKKAERLYPSVLPYRARQATLWQEWSAEQFIDAIIEISSKRTIKKFRFNESGDFYTQGCIDKLNTIARALKKLGIKTYGYSARHDLSFDNISFIVRGSGAEINGLSYVAVKASTGNNLACPGSCKSCSACLSGKVKVIECIIH
jgi:hypothetical protein